MGITRIYSADVFVSDIDRAIDFYVGTLGFETRTDEPMDDKGNRWVEVVPPGTDTPLILAHGFGHWSPDKVGVYAGLILNVDDMAGTAETLKRKGVTFSSEPADSLWGIFAEIQDPDGNTFVLFEPPAAQG